MRDLNQLVAADLPPANHQGDAMSHDSKRQAAALFMEDWPSPARCEDEEQMDEMMKIEVRKWRLQTLLAVQPFGVPSLALGQTYEKMFGVPFQLHDFGCDNLIPDLVSKMADIMIVQEPDETTPILFPEYPNDKVLHDARLGFDFSKPNVDGSGAESGSLFTLGLDPSSDCNDLILRAWLDRDHDFPEDVVLAGEPCEEMVKIALAMVQGSRGLYRATIVSSGTPESLFIRLKTTDAVLERIRGLSGEIVEYFQKTKHPIDAYNVPEQFLTLNFPCLFYSAMDRVWTRCLVVGRSRNDQRVYIESIDFGGIYAVNKIFLYLMPRQFVDLPRLTFEVALAGLKPSSGKSWSKSVGARMRCFSMQDYYLDILLIDLKRPAKAQLRDVTYIEMPSLDNSQEESEGQKVKDGIVKLDEKKKRRFVNRAAYGAIIVDRNDDDMDVYLNDVLALETYAVIDPDQSEEMKEIRAKLSKVLERIPRPTNPLGPILDL